MSKDTENGEQVEQQVTLQEHATQAFEELSGKTPDAPVDKALAIPDAPAWEAPSWAKAWPEQARNALQAIGTVQHNKGHLDPILKQIEETNKYTTNRDKEYADYKKNVDPVYSVLRDLEPNYRLQGMTLQQGVSQLVEGAKFVATDPDQAFPYFAGMYRPQNPTEAVMGIAKQWGVDLGQIAQEQPYVDPTIRALEQKLTQFELMTTQQKNEAQQREQEQAREQERKVQQAIVEKLASLEVEKDDSGNLRYPHLAQVFEDIVLLHQAGRIKTIEEGYAKALQMNPELIQSVAKDAEQAAIQEAARKSERAKQEAQANRNVSGKGTKSDAPKSKSLNDAAASAYKAVYGDQ